MQNRSSADGLDAMRPGSVTDSFGFPTMRAIVQDRYGPPDVLRPARVAKPGPAAGEVLVAVRAASVNARDWHIMRGEPRIARVLDRRTFGRTSPRQPIRGTDFAGLVESVGSGVPRWRPGDAVFGEADGAFADFVVTKADLVAAIPNGVGFEPAAAVPLAATTALLCLRDGAPEPGQTVLINGASGGVGTFAIQLARSMGLIVTAVCSARNADLARSLGADSVVDYRSADFTRLGRRFDIVVDLVGNRRLRDLRRALGRDGRLVLSGGGVSGEGRVLGPIGLLARAQLLSGSPGCG